MALALIDFISFEKGNALFRIDTGTNAFYKLKIGKTKTENGGIKWVDEIVHATSLKHTEGSHNLLGTHQEIAFK
jgi:hypothetical protein